MKVLVATSIYEAARPYLDGWINAIIAAKEHYGSSIDVLVINDGIEDAGQIFRRLASHCSVELLNVRSSSPAMTRKIMIEAAGKSDADVVVFSDCDDIPCQGGIAAHLDALRQADFSYGNMFEHGNACETLYFESDLLPEFADRGSLDRGNFVGFTNSAFHRRMLSRINPRDSVALSDWDLARRTVELGYRGLRTKVPVAYYRIADTGIASIRPRDIGGLLDAKADLARDFLLQQPDVDKFRALTEFIGNRHYNAMGAEAQLILSRKSPWFRFVFDLYDAYRVVH